MNFEDIMGASYRIKSGQIRVGLSHKFICYTLIKSTEIDVVKYYGIDNLCWLKKHPHVEAWKCLILKFNDTKDELAHVVKVGQIKTMFINSTFEILEEP